MPANSSWVDSKLESSLVVKVGASAPTSVVALTGAVTRTTFDTATVTVAQLAERFNALLIDLKTAKIIK